MEENEYYLGLVKSVYEKAKECICDRLSEIDYNQKLFSIDEKVKENGEPYFVVRYENIDYLKIMPYQENYKDIKGSRHCREQIVIRRRNDAAWYNEEYKAVFVWVNEKQDWKDNHGGYVTNDFLKKYLPVGDRQKIEKIKKGLASIDVSCDNVQFDTMNQRYVLDIDLASYLSSKKCEDDETLSLCKYMSLDTFLCIVRSKKIRLNSIVSMNDSSESFFLGDYLCDAYDDVRRKNTDFEFYQTYPNTLRYRKLIERKNELIMSLTDRKDDALMWRLYGDNGRGVCLFFDVPSKIVKPIIYISEKDEKLRSLTDVVSKWHEENIHVIFSKMEEYMFVTKSDQFEYEYEYRILEKCKDEELQIAKYGNLVSFYKDYDFEELGIKPSSLYIGSNLPNWDVNYPLLVDMAHRYLGITAINNSGVDKLRI